MRSQHDLLKIPFYRDDAVSYLCTDGTELVRSLIDVPS